VAAPSMAEAITQSFYAWETRGRGWMLADYPVSLEPPFRPLLLLPGLAPQQFARIDDGKRPTIASLLIDSAKRFFGGEPKAQPPPVPYEEEAPFPAFERASRAVLRILVPADFAFRADVMAQLLSALSAALHPVSFELIGAAGSVVLQIVCAETDCDGVRANLEAFLPELGVVGENDHLGAQWEVRAAHQVVDLGLAHEFFLPLSDVAKSRVDPYVPLIPALASAKDGEFLMLQVLVERARNPWHAAIHDALDDGEGGCLIADAPWFVPAAKKKTETPLYGVVLRIAAQADSDERALELLRSTQPFILQYANPSGNALVPLSNDGYPDGDEHAESLLLRESFRTGMLLSAEETVQLFHFPDQSVRHRALERVQVRTKELPTVAQVRGLVLGEHRHRGEQSIASLDLESRFAHTWIVGGSGTGKSTLLANLALQDIAAGHGVAVLDPHGDLIDDIIGRIPDDRIDDVILFDPSDVEFPIGFNILDARTEIEQNLLASDLVAIVRRFATSWGDTMSTVLGEAVLALLAHPEGGTLVDLRRFLVDDLFRKRYLSLVADPDIRFFWDKEYSLIGTRSLGPLLSRLDTFLRSRIIRHIVGQRDAKLDLGEAMRSGKVVLARLAKGLVGEENAYLLGSLLVAKFNQLALARQAIPQSERRPFFCYADEFQHFVTPSMESLATEGRKYRFGLVLAHQTLAQLADVPRIEGALLGNCHTRIVFRVGESDAKKLAEGFSFFETSDLAARGRGEAIARIGGASNDFNLRTLPLPRVKEDDAETRRHAISTYTRARYAVPRAELTALFARAHAPASDVDVAPIEQIEPEPATVQPPVVALPVTPEGPRSEMPAMPKSVAKAAPVVPPQSGRGGEMHKYLQHLIKRLAEERGFRATIEGVAEDGRADIVLRRDALVVGCEISVTTNAAHELENLRKCLAAGFTRVLFISPEKRQREKVAAQLRKELADAPIDVIGPEDIVTALDALGAAPATTETVVRGYKVKVRRQDLSPEDVVARRKAIAEVIARGMRK